MAELFLNRSLTSRFNAIKVSLIKIGATEKWEVDSWQAPEKVEEIIQFLNKEGISHDIAMKAIAHSMNKEIYNRVEHGDPIHSGDGWILTDGHLWVSDPYGAALQEMVNLRDRGRYLFDDYGYQISAPRKANAEDEDIDSTELDGLLNEILDSALARNASDIHISPRTSSSLAIKVRVDGRLNEYTHQIAMKDYPSFTNRVMNRTGEWGGSITKPTSLKFTHGWNGREIQIRLEVRPVVVAGKTHGYIVLRLMNATGGIRKLDDIGLEKHHYDMILKLCSRTKGLILVTGPTGSGKTTTLYGVLQKIRELRPGDSIQTLEDPVEVEVPGIDQTAINAEANMTFATGLRSVMRSDPEVILVGEIRDLETAEQALIAAETGHLVLATLHTNSSAETVSRLISLGLDRVALANALVAITAQRMVRNVCPHCSQEEVFNDNKEYVDAYSDLRFSPKDKETVLISNSEGCIKCDHGFLGRSVVTELMMVDPATERLIIDGKPASEIEKMHVDQGFETLWGHGIALAAKHRTTIKELESSLEPRLTYGENYDYKQFFTESE